MNQPDALDRPNELDRPNALDAAGTLSADADPDRLSQVLWNLLDNAVRHTPPGAEVGIRFSAERDAVRLQVRNPGPVIDPDAARRLFERFARGDGRSRTGADGTDGGAGLGLAIARKLIEAHGGTITAEAPPDGGLSIDVRWPAANPPGNAAQRGGPI